MERHLQKLADRRIALRMQRWRHGDVHCCWIHGKSVYLNIIQQQISVSKARWRRVPNTRKK